MPALLDGRLARVMKTAAFGSERRIGVAWLGTRVDDKATGRFQWGGHLLRFFTQLRAE